jgi:antitoxin VapB
MAFSIENNEADLLAPELADLTGESLTQAILNSLRERLERQRILAAQGGFYAKIQSIQGDYQSSPSLDDRSPDEILGYDEDGMPFHVIDLTFNRQTWGASSGINEVW